MAKVDLNRMRTIREIMRLAMQMYSHALQLYVQEGNDGYFCRECGETDPEEGFYPLYAEGPGCVSSVICNPCERESRARFQAVNNKRSTERVRKRTMKRR